MVTQEEVLIKLEREGYTLSKRTLGYWRGESLLPPLEREGQQYYWKEDILNKIRNLCVRRKEREILTTFELEGQRFEVERIEIKRINNSPIIITYLSNGTFMVKRTREEKVNAFTKI